MNLIKRILSIFIHVLIIVGLYIAFLPIAKLFYYHDLPLGNDTLNFMYYTQEFRNNLAFPVSAWKFQAFEGMPRVVDTSWLHFYVIQPLVSWLGIMPATKIYILAFFFLFIAFSYLLFYELSRNYLLSGGLALILLKTGNIYVPLFSSGVVLSSISQTFFPLTMYFLVRFFKRNELKSFYLAAVSLALAVFTHPGVGTLITLICAGIFLVFISTSTVGLFNVKSKFKLALKFFVISGMLMSIAILPDIYTKLFEGGHQWMVPVYTAQKELFSFLFSTLNAQLFVVAATSFIVGIIFIKNINKFFLPFLGFIIYFFAFVGATYLGKNPLGGIFFSHRISWMFVISLLALTATLVSPEATFGFGKIKKGISIFLSIIIIPAISLTCLTIPLKQIFNFMPGDIFSTVKTDNLAGDTDAIWSKPFLSLTNTDLSFFEESDLQYRFYAMDYAQNLALGFISRLPQNRGGFHFSTWKNVNWYAWYDAALADESQTKGRLNPYVAEQQSLYLIDWYATKYMFSCPCTPGLLASWFTREDSPYIGKKSIKNGDMMLRVKDEYTSPIVVPSNAKVIGFIGSRQGYDSFLRNLGILVYNSKFVIPIHLQERLEDVKDGDLSDIDGLIIYSYREKDKEKHLASWGKIENFVKNGGVVLVETGSDSPEKYLPTLPEIFPIEKITIGTVGTEWQVTTKGNTFNQVDFTQLSPLTYEGSYWGVDYTTQIKPGGTLELAINDKILVAERTIGRGKFIWSGINFFYRTHYFHTNAQNEINIFKNLLDNEFGVTKQETPAFKFNRPKSEKIILFSSNARGDLFKENNYGGWVANASSGTKSRNLKIYPAGPDFMYVRLPSDVVEGNFEMVFKYKGRLDNWLFFGLTVFGLALVIDGIFLNQKLFRLLVKPFTALFAKTGKRVFGWWEKDE